MGLIKVLFNAVKGTVQAVGNLAGEAVSGLGGAAMSSASSVLKDQFKEFFVCESIDVETIIVKGQKKSTANGHNQGTDNVITNGSLIVVNEGQCMIIVDQGKVVDLCAEPGEYVYDMSTEPSIFAGGGLGNNIKESFKNLGKRISFGGEVPKDQRIYYFNTKELIGNKYGTPQAVPFKNHEMIGNSLIPMNIRLKCFGTYSYKVTDPIIFYTNICGNVTSSYRRQQLDETLKSEFLTALQPALARLSVDKISYTDVVGKTKELAIAMRAELSKDWSEARGIEIVNVGVTSITPDDESDKKIQELQEKAIYMDATFAAGSLVQAQGQAMTTAAANPNGAMMGFMGMGMAQQAGGMNAQTLYGLGQQQQMQQPQYQQPVQQQPAPAQMAPATAVGGWTCSCGATATGKFCPECGSKKPEEQAPAGWTCSCGAVNTGKFCAECGGKKPEAAPAKCAQCGWTPADPSAMPKFCPECGTRF